MGFADASTETLLITRGRLLSGLDKVAAHVDAGTFEVIAPGRASPPSEAGQLTRILLEGVDAELERRGETMQRVVLVDVDGTVALMGKGQPGRRRPYDWHRVGEDDPNQPVIDLVDILRAHFPIIFVSGRDEVCREATQQWLDQHGAIRVGEPLFMRPAKDNRGDDLIKMEIYKREIEPRFRVAYVLDDRDRVVRTWRSLGLTVLQVADGNF